jgi:lambda family phage tail tape measure protein
MADNINININAKDNASGALKNVTANINKLNQTTAGTQKSIAGVTTAFSGFRTMMLGFASITAGALSVREVIRYTDTWTDLNSRLLQATGSTESAKRALEGISQTARRTYTSLEQTAEIFLRNNTTLRELGYTTREQIQLTDALNNALVISGTKGQQAESVQNALAKAFASGTLSGQNFNTVIQNGGRLVQALADGLGVTTLELRRMSTEGLLTTRTVFEALTSQTQKLASEADKMSATISDAFVILRNSLLEYIGSVDQASGATGGIAQAIIFLADNLAILVKLLTAVTLLFAARFVAPILRATAALFAFGKSSTSLLRPIASAKTALTSFFMLIERGMRGAIGSRGGPTAIVQISRSLLGMIPILGGATVAVYGLFTAFSAFVQATSPKLKQLKQEIADVKSAVEATIETSSLEELGAQAEESERRVESLKEQIAALNLELRKPIRTRDASANRPALERMIADMRVEEARLQALRSGLADLTEQSQLAAIRLAEEQSAAAKAAREKVEDVIAALQEQVMLLDKTNLEQDIYNQLKLAGAAATDDEKSAIQSLVTVLHLEREAQKDLADEQERRRRAVEALTDAIRDNKAASDAIVSTTQEELRSAREMAEVYGVQRQILSQMNDFEQTRLRNLAQLRAAAEAAAAAGVDGAYDELEAVEKRWDMQRAALEDLVRGEAEYQRQFSTGWKQAFADFADAATNEAMYAKNLFNTFTDGITNAIMRFAEGGKLSFKDLFRSMLAEVIKFQTNKAVLGMLGMFGGGGSGLGSFFGKLFGGAREKGGPVSDNKAYLVGERGPELFVPRSAGTVVSNKQMGAGQQSITNNYITNNINAVDAKSVAQLFIENRQSLLGATMMANREMPYGMV